MSCRILIADDDVVFCTVAASCLTAAGFEACSVQDGSQAMELLVRDHFDLAMVDLMMPQIDGLRLIALIRATPHLTKMPILIVTSLEDETVQNEGYQVGANACLTKPVDWTALPDTVKALLKFENADREI